MSELNGINKIKFEKLFGMSSGYVLNFSNREFRTFIVDSIGIDVYEGEYASKANLLRNLWENKSNYKIGKLLLDFLEYMKEENLVNDENLNLYVSCEKIANNLKNNSKINNLELSNLENDKTLDLLLQEIKNSRDKENPEIILDRLHTLSSKYIKQLTKKYNINSEGKSLNALFGLYIKELEKRGIIESDITLLIVKSNISILEKFNYIRNNKSLAHDNEILNSNESTFIINNIINLLHFIETLENIKSDKDSYINPEDLPF